ncbi:NAD-dependent deacetylase sirtuin-2 [Dothidotthia symphoricarpi CBS 119687]|uniref:NAD-dependent protein deacetylase n=1 Tax=Dothidotthia symphoricarpi CBS 119687 TaxID=1392245 RepID=A0A6A5ZXW8_9PLEO|nr:NAD-dependent deacetylase sirtuin-2 [Dothidotthia symphoricarpi CBS 119687]KAF2124126.1 NAD-dependent deacetylase sirtuin-2 [Dothidotthia symphoricarpi CBS 119687]
MGNEESTMVGSDSPTQTLEARTLEALAQYITEGRARKIVVMVGAGISTSAGIPDFRSPETGLYANLERLNLPHAEAVFEISYFRENPLPFYTLAQELYPGKFRPTITHSFVTLLHKKGLLLKLFSQNIDCLEREAGLPDEMIIEAHGSFAKQSCIDCKKPYPKDLMQTAIQKKSVPRCLDLACNGLVKPEIVFFGEQLPAEFFANRDLPSEADLCIVMGTSLSVQPFASLPSCCEGPTPRLLINQERVGDLGHRADDVLLLEDCDSGVRKLAEACGWLEELEALWAETAREGDITPTPETVKKSRDEKLQDKVDKLTSEVERNLKLSQEQHSWLDKHLDKKIARKEEEDEKEVESSNTQPTDDAKTLKLAPVASADADATEKKSVGELGHVFPHLTKEPAKKVDSEL